MTIACAEPALGEASSGCECFSKASGTLLPVAGAGLTVAGSVVALSAALSTDPDEKHLRGDAKAIWLLSGGGHGRPKQHGTSLSVLPGLPVTVPAAVARRSSGKASDRMAAGSDIVMSIDATRSVIYRACPEEGPSWQDHSHLRVPEHLLTKQILILVVTCPGAESSAFFSIDFPSSLLVQQRWQPPRREASALRQITG